MKKFEYLINLEKFNDLFVIRLSCEATVDQINYKYFQT